MKKFTSFFLKLSFFSFILVAVSFSANGANWDANSFHLESENTSDGRAVFNFERYDDGNLIWDSLYVQANIEGVWTTVFHFYHYYNEDGGNRYDWKIIQFCFHT